MTRRHDLVLARAFARDRARDLALFAWAFNPGTRNLTPPADITAALGWIAAASVNVAALDDPAVIRAALGACAVTLSGTPSAATTQRRKRSVLYNALGYAVEIGLLAANPVDRIQWKSPGVAETVDRRVVAGRPWPAPCSPGSAPRAPEASTWRRSTPASTRRDPPLRSRPADRARPHPAVAGLGPDRPGRPRIRRHPRRRPAPLTRPRARDP